MLEESEKLEKLLDWLHSASSSKISEYLEVKDTIYGGRGIFAKELVKSHQQIIKISPSFLLNFTTIIAHITAWNDQTELPLSYKHIQLPSKLTKDEITNEIYSKLRLEDLLKLTSFQIVSLFLVLEKKRGTNSWWFPFIQMLPEDTDFVLSPFVWKVKEKTSNYKKLPKSTQSHAEKMYTLFNNDYSTLIRLLETVNSQDIQSLLSKDDLLWAWMCVNSRCLYMEIPEGKTTADNFTMAPYVDFINHSPVDQCTLRIDRTGFYVQTTLSYPENTELFLSYGPHSNEFLLCEYGFTLPSNDWNDLDITEEITTLLSEQQEEFLKNHDYFGEYTINKDGASFRTEVALAVIQETVEFETNRKLKALLNGLSDGAAYKKKSDRILKTILKDSKIKSEKNQNLEFDNDPFHKVIGQLYRERVEIIEHTLNHLQGSES